MGSLRVRLGWIVLVAAGLALAGCGDKKDETDAKNAKSSKQAEDTTTEKPKPLDPHLPPPGSNEAVKDGYLAGCDAGTAAAARSSSAILANAGVDKKTDERRYARDIDYKRGWDQGYFACYDAEKHTSFFDNLIPF
ncbi:MAG TPA: hypothetical protein VKY65_03500 [Alphaproteobacteria bacterium]|nr:hypothetical protein [Alphaproteobacteria bacterium]